MSCAYCAKIGAYLYNAARWLDQGLNMAVGGDPVQTFSSRLGRAELGGNKVAAYVCRGLSFVFREEDHCVKAVVEADNAREVIDLDGADGRVEEALKARRDAAQGDAR